MFDIALQVVRAGLESDDWWAGHADGRYLMNLALQALSASLSWDFAKDDTGLESTIAKKQRDEDEVAVSTPLFPETWRDVLVRPDVLDVFFHVSFFKLLAMLCQVSRSFYSSSPGLRKVPQ